MLTVSRRKRGDSDPMWYTLRNESLGDDEVLGFDITMVDALIVADCDSLAHLECRKHQVHRSCFQVKVRRKGGKI